MASGIPTPLGYVRLRSAQSRNSRTAPATGAAGLAAGVGGSFPATGPVPAAGLLEADEPPKTDGPLEAEGLLEAGLLEEGLLEAGLLEEGLLEEGLLETKGSLEADGSSSAARPINAGSGAAPAARGSWIPGPSTRGTTTPTAAITNIVPRPPTTSGPRRRRVGRAETQSCQPGGTGPQAGSGRQSTGGVQPSGGFGQYGGGLKLQPSIMLPDPPNVVTMCCP